jgi:hypothetical protein
VAYLDRGGRSAGFSNDCPPESVVRRCRVGDEADVDSVPCEQSQRTSECVPVTDRGRQRSYYRAHRSLGLGQFQDCGMGGLSLGCKKPRRLYDAGERRNAPGGCCWLAAKRLHETAWDLDFVAIEQLQSLEERGGIQGVEALRRPTVAFYQPSI